MLNLNAIAIAVAVVLPVAAQSWTGCTADEDCLGTPNWRCLQASGTNGSPCVLDYAFNETGYCSCQPQSCVVNTAGQTTTNPQMLVIGDSISLGFFPFLSKLMPNWEIVHAPSFSGSENNDNANWGNRCAHGWLGPNSTSWDAVVINFGLHDLAFEDNEHIDVDTYAILVSGVLGQIRASVKANATLIWNAITPVPTNPPSNCTLIPGRLESNVLAYNAAAAKVVAVTQADRFLINDLHKVITDVCGVGYASCPIAQCAGPHFQAAGFELLAGAVAGCVVNGTASPYCSSIYDRA